MKKVFFIFLTLFSSLSYSANHVTGYSNIEFIRVSEETKIAYIKITGQVGNINSTCGARDMYALNTNDDNFSVMQSMILAAGMANKRVKFWITDVSGDCLNDRQRVKVVEVKF